MLLWDIIDLSFLPYIDKIIFSIDAMTHEFICKCNRVGQ